MVDFHIHLARLPRPKELALELERRDYQCVIVACEPWEWEEIAQLKGCVSFHQLAFGIHPMVAEKISEEHFNRLEELLRKDGCAMVGEAGLDKRYPGYEEGGIQEQVFTRQVEMARKLGRDLQIHCVGDYGRIIRILKKAGFGKVTKESSSQQLENPLQSENIPQLKNQLQSKNIPQHEIPLQFENIPRPIFHRFGGDSGIVKAALPLGAIFSLHRDSFRKKSTAVAIKEIPAHCIRFETDADESWTEILKGCDKENAEILTRELGQVMNSFKNQLTDFKLI